MWTLDLQTEGDGKDQSGEDAEADSQQPKLSQLNNKVTHPWILPGSPLNHYRSEAVYHVPAHLKVHQAVQVLLAREGALPLFVGQQAEVTLSTEDLKDLTLEELAKQQLERKLRLDEDTIDNIIDIHYERSILLKGTKEIADLQTSPRSRSDRGTRISTPPRSSG